MEKSQADMLAQYTRDKKFAYRAFRSGKRFMAFDVEKRNGELQEMGVTLFQGRSMESFNYRVSGFKRETQFIFGKTIEADLDVVKNLIQIHAPRADYYVGHGIVNDFEYLEDYNVFLPRRYVYDTGFWSRALFGHTLKLKDLASRYNVGQSQFHCGGNDARYTAEIFLKMIHEDD